MAEILILRLVHVLGGIFWVGAALFNAVFLLPAMQAAGPAAGALMETFQRRRLFIVLPVLALLTVLSGVRLMWIVSGGFEPAWFASGRGIVYSTSGGAAILAFLLGAFLAGPTGKRIGQLRGSLGTTEDAAERARLEADIAGMERRIAVLGKVLNPLLVLAAAGMAIGRYVV